MKVCSCCGQSKAESEYQKGYNKCKSCRAQQQREYRKTGNGRKVITKHLSLDKTKEQRRDYMREYSRSNPQYNQARNAVANAIRIGKLVPQLCEVCGLVEVEAHHCDYNKPLEVMWLCKRHHVEWHENNIPVEML